MHAVGRFHARMSRTTYKNLHHFPFWWPYEKLNRGLLCIHVKHCGKQIESNSHLELFILFLWNRWENCHMSYGTQRNAPISASFSIIFRWKMPFSSRKLIDIVNESSTFRWLWNQLSFHFHLAYITENNLKISKFSSTESPPSFL